MAEMFCPTCKTETVEAPEVSFHQTSVEVTPCQPCRSSLGLVSVRMRMSEFATSGVRHTVRHTTGLVSFEVAR